MRINHFVIIRVFIGSIFIVSGFEKLIGPYQNFLFVVQTYDFLFPMIEVAVARILPWGELLIGVFVVLGLWLRLSLRALIGLMAMFIFVVGQAMVRSLPIEECGCFGELISFPLHIVIIFDSTLLLLSALLVENEERASLFSLDRYLNS